MCLEHPQPSFEKGVTLRNLGAEASLGLLSCEHTRVRQGWLEGRGEEGEIRLDRRGRVLNSLRRLSSGTPTFRAGGKLMRFFFTSLGISGFFFPAGKLSC